MSGTHERLPMVRPVPLIVFLVGTPPLLRPQERSTSRILYLPLLRTANPRCARAHADLPRR